MSQPVLKLHNTLTGRLEEFVPLEGGKVRLYVCGPTVYDAAHLGHARCYITWDVLVRFLRFLGYDVTYVRNVTDVDDKILNRARETGKTPAQVAAENLDSFHRDMAALNTLPPDVEPKATEYIGAMQEMIRQLIGKGAAYVTEKGNVYFNRQSDRNYYQLSKKPPEALAAARVEAESDKRDPADFALWKAVPPEEQTDEKLAQGYCFESPWGRGRPGWHIECSAMNWKVFGSPQIDIHTGGADLIFPHHENEIAQTETCFDLEGGPEHPDKRFAKYWLHNGFVNVSGEKMSKSLGNFSTIRKVLERYDANTIRYFLLTNKYDKPVDFNDEALEGAENAMARISRKIRASADHFGLHEASQVVSWLQGSSPDASAFVQVMADDLNTSRALALLNEALDADGFGNAILILHHLGFDFGTILLSGNVLPKEEIRTIYKEMTGKWLEPDREPEVLLTEIINLRKEAKATRNWTQADAIRKHLSDIGIQLMDNKDGTTTWELAKK